MLKSLYKRFIRFTQKGGSGFTLVELMIVMAVIAILALVLLPRLGNTKNKARETGLKVNMALIEGEIHTVIDNFTTDPADVSDLETRIATDLNAALETTTTSQKLMNPVTKITGCVDITAVATGGAVIYDGSGADNDPSTIDSGWPDTQANLAGMVAYGAYVNATTNRVEVKLIPYDSTGNKLTEMEKVISQ